MSQTTISHNTQAVVPPQGAQQQGPAPLMLRPRIDLFESADAWQLRAEMPGVSDEHVEVSLEQQLLTIRGTAPVFPPEGYAPQSGEFRPRVFERTFRLPVEIDRTGIDAEIRHGVLTVRIPKAPQAQPTRVTVRAG